MTDPLFPPPPERPNLVETAAQGQLSGPSYTYRGAVIDYLKGGHVCTLPMEGHPLDGHGFGAAGTITPLVDLWLNEGRLPRYMRAVPKAKR